MSTQSNVLRPALAAITLVGVLGWPCLASAESQRAQHAAAQTLFDEGRRLMAEGALDVACAKLEESARIVRFGGTLLNLGDCYERQGRLATAWSTFISAATAASHAGNTAREREARNRVAALASRLPKLVIRVAGMSELPGLEVRRDEAVVGMGQYGTPIPVDPGPHRVVVEASGYQVWQVDVDVEPGSTVTVEVPQLERVVEPATEPASTRPGSRAPRKQLVEIRSPLETGKAAEARRSPHSADLRSAALVAGGVGGIGLAAAAIFGALSLHRHNQADQHCDGDACRDETGLELRNTARSLGNFSTVGFIIGAVGVATGVTLWVAAPTQTSARARLNRFSLHSGGVAVDGAWD